jgi:hypothetical protein
MALPTVSFDSITAVQEIESSMDLLTKNTLTTAGVVIAAGTGVAGAAVLAAALPAQILTAAAVSGGLIYAGDRQAKGLSVNPFAALSAPKAPVMSDDYDHTAGVDVEATSV